MSIYATLRELKFPLYGQAHTDCEWETVLAQGVPEHSGEDGDDHYLAFLPPPARSIENGLRVLVFMLGIHRRRTAVGDATGQRADDAGVVYRTKAAVLKRGALGSAFQPASQAGGRQEDRRLDKWQAHLGFGDGRLPAQQADQALGFAVGQDKWVVRPPTSRRFAPRCRRC